MTDYIRFRCSACGQRYAHLQESLKCSCRDDPPGSSTERAFHRWVDRHWEKEGGCFNATPTLREAFLAGAKYAAHRMKEALATSSMDLYRRRYLSKRRP